MTRLTNKAELPDPIVQAVKNDSYDAGDSDITVTQLIQPPRKVELERRHDGEMEEDVADRIYALIGQTVHEILERAEGVMLAEQRLYTPVNEWAVSGKFDRCALIDGGKLGVVLQDYKLASVWEAISGLKQDRIDQLNLLAELARQNGYRVDKLQAVLIYRDWSRLKAEHDKTYPQQQVAVFDVPLWFMDDAQRFMARRVQAHQEARQLSDDDLPACTPEERWQKETQYAVHTPGRKKALKLHNSQVDAEAHARQIDGAYVQERPGEATRCKHYCHALPFCAIGQSLVHKKGTTDAA